MFMARPAPSPVLARGSSVLARVRDFRLEAPVARRRSLFAALRFAFEVPLLSREQQASRLHGFRDFFGIAVLHDQRLSPTLRVRCDMRLNPCLTSARVRFKETNRAFETNLDVRPWLLTEFAVE